MDDGFGLLWGEVGGAVDDADEFVVAMRDVNEVLDVQSQLL